MNILGMGPMEILLIVVLALIVFGPARLPEIMAQVGKAIADFRRTTSALSDEFNRTIQAELQETRAMVDETRSAVTGVHTSINAAISGTPAPPLTTPAPAPTLNVAPANGTNGTHTESAPPLADTSQWSWETAAPAPSGPAATTASAASPAGAPAASISSTPPVLDAPTAPEPVVAAPPAPVHTLQPDPSASRDASRDGSPSTIGGGGRGAVAPGRKSTRRDDLLPPY